MGSKKVDKKYEIDKVENYNYEEVEQLKQAMFNDIDSDEKVIIDSMLKRLGIQPEKDGSLPSSIEYEKTMTVEYIPELQSSSVYRVTFKFKKPAVVKDESKKVQESEVELANKKLAEMQTGA